MFPAAPSLTPLVPRAPQPGKAKAKQMQRQGVTWEHGASPLTMATGDAGIDRSSIRRGREYGRTTIRSIKHILLLLSVPAWVAMDPPLGRGILLGFLN